MKQISTVILVPVMSKKRTLEDIVEQLRLSVVKRDDVRESRGY